MILLLSVVSVLLLACLLSFLFLFFLVGQEGLLCTHNLRGVHHIAERCGMGTGLLVAGLWPSVTLGVRGCSCVDPPPAPFPSLRLPGCKAGLSKSVPCLSLTPPPLCASYSSSLTPVLKTTPECVACASGCAWRVFFVFVFFSRSAKARASRVCCSGHRTLLRRPMLRPDHATLGAV